MQLMMTFSSMSWWQQHTSIIPISQDSTANTSILLSRAITISIWEMQQDLHHQHPSISIHFLWLINMEIKRFLWMETSSAITQHSMLIFLLITLINIKTLESYQSALEEKKSKRKKLIPRLQMIKTMYRVFSLELMFC